MFHTELINLTKQVSKNVCKRWWWRDNYKHYELPQSFPLNAIAGSAFLSVEVVLLQRVGQFTIHPLQLPNIALKLFYLLHLLA